MPRLFDLLPDDTKKELTVSARKPTGKAAGGSPSGGDSPRIRDNYPRKDESRIHNDDNRPRNDESRPRDNNFHKDENRLPRKDENRPIRYDKKNAPDVSPDKKNIPREIKNAP